GNGDRGSQLWVANADGTGAHALTPTPAGCPDADCTEAIQPVWSPDGKTIAYVAVRHRDGSYVGSAPATFDVATGVSTTIYSVTDALLLRPTWAPDSRRIALEIDRYKGTPEDSATAS